MRRTVLGMALSILAAAASCDRAAPDRRPWRASDHDRTDEPAAGVERTAPTPTPAASTKPDPGDSLIETTWRMQCAVCHGAKGRSDGQGSRAPAADLSRPDWQKRTSDAEIAAVITSGRGRMPRFDLPPLVVSGLVQHIRSLRQH
jgi:mono/diheme cytochrome c family protein